MPALRPVVSSPLPSEPDLRISPHPALHQRWSGRPLVQLAFSVKYPLPVQAAARRYSPATSFHPIVLLAHWTPSPSMLREEICCGGDGSRLRAARGLGSSVAGWA